MNTNRATELNRYIADKLDKIDWAKKEIDKLRKCLDKGKIYNVKPIEIRFSMGNSSSQYISIPVSDSKENVTFLINQRIVELMGLVNNCETFIENASKKLSDLTNNI